MCTFRKFKFIRFFHKICQEKLIPYLIERVKATLRRGEATSKRRILEAKDNPKQCILLHHTCVEKRTLINYA